MNEKQQIEWLMANNATVWFGPKGWLGDTKGIRGVKVKVGSTLIWGRTLQEAIASIEKNRSAS